LADGAAPLSAPLHPTAQGPADGAAFWITATDGVRLRLGLWNRDGARGTVLLFPGRTECVEKYGRTAGDLAGLGFATLTIDWRGQGLAERLLPNPRLGHVGDFADYQKDVAAMLAFARTQNLPEPFWLLAHSMGGCLGLRSLFEGLPVKAAVFSAPMWGITITPPVMRAVAWGLTALAGPLGMAGRIAPGQTEDSFIVTGGFQGNTLTSDPDMWDYMRAQLVAQPDLTLGGPTLAWLGGALREMRRLAALPSPALPCLTFLGSDEQIVDPGRIRARMPAWPGGALVELPGARHEVLMETPAIRARVMDRLDRLFRA
jgi:lysophospholipase